MYKNKMPSRSASRSYSRGRASKRFRSRSVSRGSGMYASALRSSSRSGPRYIKRIRPSLNVHNFSRYTAAATLECSGTESRDAFQFKFSDILNYTEFSALFDQYKITKVILQLQLITNPDAFGPTNTTVAGTNNPSNWYPKFWYIRDTDGGSSDTLAEIKERQGVKCFVLRPNKTFRIAITPYVAVQTYRTSTTTGYGPKRLYLDFANGVDVPHYGMNYVIDALGVDPSDTYPFKVRYEFKYYFTCKDVR